MSTQKVIFCLEVPNISERIESKKFSSNVILWNVPWKIQVWKVVTETSESLGVELQCLNESNEDWSYATTATYRLCSFDDELQPFEYKMRPRVVNKTDKPILTNAFIKWQDLFDTEKQYVEDDTIKMEFGIVVANLNLPDSSVLQSEGLPSHCFTKFELSIKNTKRLLAVQSQNFFIAEEEYFLVVSKYDAHLAVELCQLKDMESSSRPMMLVKLISANGNDKSVVHYSQFHMEKLISWKELLKPENGFNCEDTIKFEVTIMAEAAFHEAKEIFETILSAGNVVSDSTFSCGASLASVTAMAASLTLNGPSLPITVPASQTKTTITGFKGYGTASNTVTGGSLSQVADTIGSAFRAPVPSASSSLNSSATFASAKLSSATEEEKPSFKFPVPASTVKATNTGFKGFGAAGNIFTGGLSDRKPDFLGSTFRAPVPSTSFSTVANATEKPRESAVFKDSSTVAASATLNSTFNTNQSKSEQQNSANESALIFTNTFNDISIAKFELLIKNANKLKGVGSQNFSILDKSYKFVVRKLQDHLNVELQASCSDLRTQPIMLVTLVSNKGAAKSIQQYTRFQTEKLISWKELQNPENGFNYDNLIKIEVVIVKLSTDLKETGKILQLQFLHSINLSVRRFCIEVPQISNLDVFLSPKFLIHGVPWCVEVCKETIDAEQYLAVYVFCKPGTAHFSHAASRSIMLISFDENVRAVQHDSGPYCFIGGGDFFGGPIIGWEDLFDRTKCFVKDDKIVLDIKINFDDPKTTIQPTLTFDDVSNSLKDDQKAFKITIGNVDSLLGVALPQFELRNIEFDWQVLRDQNRLVVFLYPFDQESQTMVIELLSSKSENKSVNADDRYTEIITWSELFNVKNGFVNNNSITLQVTISSNIEDVSDFNGSETSTEIQTNCPT